MASPPPAAQVTFEDVALYFSREEWAELREWQRDLYCAVMMDNYKAVAALGWASLKPEIIRRIEQEEELHVGEFWKPFKWKMPRSPWLAGDAIRMEDEERGERTGSALQSRPSPESKRRKTIRAKGAEKQMTRVRHMPPKAQHDTLPRLTLKMNPPKCPECGKSFLSNVAMTIHIRTHTGERPFKCHLCPKGFPSRGDLNRHSRMHQRKKDTSPPSGKNSVSKGRKSVTAKLQLLRNTLRPPDPQKPHKCSQCGKSFSKKQSLRKHAGTHSTERPFSCLECGHSFRLKQILVSHMKSHMKERPFACPECGKCFTQERTVRNHQRVHTGEKPFSCLACGKCFAYKQHLVKHLRLHTGERPFTCEECGKTFRDKTTLGIHNRMHTGERPYRCPFCGKACRQKQHLNSHLKVHRGEQLPVENGRDLAVQRAWAKEKPYECPRCEKRFRDKKILLAHQVTHEEEQLAKCSAIPSPAEPKSVGRGGDSSQKCLIQSVAPTARASFVCLDCGRGFTQGKYLTLHRKGHR